MDQEKGLKTVFFLVDTLWEKEKNQFIEMLEGDGVTCQEWTGTETEGLLITDCREVAGKAVQNGMICIGLEQQMGHFFEGAVLVCDSLAELDAQMLEETYLHACGIPVTVAETRRLLIREISENDLEELCMISRSEGMEYLMPEGKNAEDFFNTENLSAYRNTVYRFYGYGLWSVLLKDGTLIGCCGLQNYVPEDARGENSEHQLPEGKSCLELQYMLAPKYRRKGYGTEMCLAALNYAFARTDADMVCVRCHPENRAAIALAGKLGFEHRGAILAKNMR